MTSPVPLRPELQSLGGYHSPQVAAEVRLNTNESPFPPPDAWRTELAAAVTRVEFHRYPDRGATELREGIAELHGVTPEEVFCANGSNEVLQCLLLAYGGPGRGVLLFEPTYALHSHIARLTGTAVTTGPRGADLRIDAEAAGSLLEAQRPEVTFVCSPNNPTGRLENPDLVALLVARAPGLVVVDEAYGQFSSWSALSLHGQDARGALVVVRTFSKTWAMAGSRLGYLVADRDVVAGCEQAALPYHLSATTQLAGVLALRYHDEMTERVATVAAAREHLGRGLAELPVQSWPSDANFLLFRPLGRDAATVWKDLLAQGVLVRDFSSRPGLEGCLRVTVGTKPENERFLDALARALR